VFGREVEGGQRVAIPQASANIEGMAPAGVAIRRLARASAG
jgi:hypothetical protein